LDFVSHDLDVFVDLGSNTIDSGFCERDVNAMSGKMGRFLGRALETTASDLLKSQQTMSFDGETNHDESLAMTGTEHFCNYKFGQSG